MIRRGRQKGDPVKKPTGFLTNSPAGTRRAVAGDAADKAASALELPAARHALCSGIHAKDAARYPRGLCQAILRGVTQQLRVDELLKDGCYGVQVADDEEEIRRNTHSPELGYSGKYRDDLTGQLLKDELVGEGACD